MQPQDDLFQLNNWGTNSSTYLNTSYANHQDLLGIPDLWSLAGPSGAGSQPTMSAPAEQQQGHSQGQAAEGYTAYHSKIQGQDHGHVPAEYTAYHPQNQGQDQGQILDEYPPYNPPNQSQAQGQIPDDYQPYDAQHQA
jgi:hypothetical protein